MKHNWIEKEVPEDMKKEFTNLFICSRGDCKCEKWVFFTGVLYDRNSILYHQCPECYGDVPINQQNNINL